MTVDLYILAAGRSSRMGRLKPLVELGGYTLLARAVRAGQGTAVRSVTVVTGRAHQAVEQEASVLGAGTLWNQGYANGLATSVAAAARHAGSRAEPAGGLLLAGCDQPYLTAGVLDRLITAAQGAEGCAAACSYGESIGIPALFPAGWWQELLNLEGDRGAKAVLQRRLDQVVQVRWEPGGINVNRPDDLDRIDPASLPDPGNPIMFV